MKFQQLLFFDTEKHESAAKPVNVSAVPQRSPFRYPGGKTWLIPVVRQWLRQDKQKIALLVEPFGGGGIVSLTAAFENLAEAIVLSEIDPDVAAVWHTILGEDNDWLANKISTFELQLDNIQRELQMPNQDTKQTAFNTILKNRILHGGIMAKGAGLIKTGENGKGLASRWYPKTLKTRIQNIKSICPKIKFFQADAFEILQQHANNKQAFFFIDPPYTVAGKRLYAHYDIDHEKLFALVAQLKGRFMLTYDDTPYIRILAQHHNLPYRIIPMKTTHHLQKNEIILCDNNNW